MESAGRGGWWAGWLLLLHRRRDRPRTPANGEGGDCRQLALLAGRPRVGPAEDPHAGPRPGLEAGAALVELWSRPGFFVAFPFLKRAPTVTRRSKHTRQKPIPNMSLPWVLFNSRRYQKVRVVRYRARLMKGGAALGGGRDRHANARVAQGGWVPRGVERGAGPRGRALAKARATEQLCRAARRGAVLCSPRQGRGQGAREGVVCSCVFSSASLE